MNDIILNHICIYLDPNDIDAFRCTSKQYRKLLYVIYLQKCMNQWKLSDPTNCFKMTNQFYKKQEHQKSRIVCKMHYPNLYCECISMSTRNKMHPWCYIHHFTEIQYHERRSLCLACTKKGTPCTRYMTSDSEYCKQHKNYLRLPSQLIS